MDFKIALFLTQTKEIKFVSFKLQLYLQNFPSKNFYEGEIIICHLFIYFFNKVIL